MNVVLSGFGSDMISVQVPYWPELEIHVNPVKYVVALNWLASCEDAPTKIWFGAAPSDDVMALIAIRIITPVINKATVFAITAITSLGFNRNSSPFGWIFNNTTEKNGIF